MVVSRLALLRCLEMREDTIRKLYLAVGKQLLMASVDITHKGTEQVDSVDACHMRLCSYHAGGLI
jgi:hypothetical protein